MKNLKTIYCFECGKAIKYRNELVIAGKMMQPYHYNCFMNPKKFVSKMNKFKGAFPLGSRFWFWLIVGNVIAGAICTIETNSLTILYAFIVLCNVVFISARVGIYYTYERHLI